MIVIIDLVIIVSVWLPTLAVRHRMVPSDALPGWIDHLAWAVLLVAFWLLATRLDPGLRRRSPGGFGATVLRLLGPTIVMGLSPQLSHGLELNRSLPMSLMILWSALVLAVMSAVRAARAESDETPPQPRGPEARLAFWSAGGGLLALAFVPWFPKPDDLYWLEDVGFLGRFLRGLVQMVGLIGVAVWVGIALARPLAWVRRFVLTTRRWPFLAAAAGLAVVLSAMYACFVLDRMPHVIDELAMLFQAKNFAAGRFYAQTPPMVEAFDCEFIVVDGERWYGKYLPGPSLLLVPGVWLGATWIVNPLLGAVAIMLLFVLARQLFGEHVGRLAVLLALVSPFWLMTFASQMSHPGCTTVLLVFAVFMVKATRPAGRSYHAVVAGLALAGAVWFRPYTAMVWAVPWLVYGLVAVVRRRTPRAMVPWFAVSVVIGVLPLFAYNKILTGDALLMPFVKYAPTDRLGFGWDVGLPYAAPGHLGGGHTLTKGLNNMALQVDALSRTLLGWPRGVLLLVVIGGLYSALRWHGLMVLGLGVSLPIAYVFYHFGTPCYGPRYYASALPAYLILVAIGLGALRRGLQWQMKRWRLPRSARYAWASTWALMTLALVGCLFGYMPGLIEKWRNTFWVTDPAVRDAVEQDRPKNAIVFLRSTYYRSLKHKRFLRLPDNYGAGFWMNAPTLDDEVIFARDLERELSRKFPPGTNQRVLASFPGRRGYRFVRDDLRTGHLEPLVSEPNQEPAAAGKEGPGRLARPHAVPRAVLDNRGAGAPTGGAGR